MKILYITVLAALGFLLGTLLVNAEDSDSSASVHADVDIEASQTSSVHVMSNEDGEIEYDMATSGTADISVTKTDSADSDSEDDDAANVDISITNTVNSDDIDVETKGKESGEKGGTADINIGVGEHHETEASDDGHKDWINLLSVSHSSDAAETNKAELLDEIETNSDGGLRSSGYVKLGDIKGESTDAGHTSKKPKEIVVVGSKVRADDVPQLTLPEVGDEVASDSFFDIWVESAGQKKGTVDSFFDISTDVSDEDLHLQAVSVAQSDKNVKEVSVNDDGVQVDYDEEVKLFGLIPLHTTKVIEVNTNAVAHTDRVKVRFPWWHVFATKDTDSAELSAQIEGDLSAKIPEATDTEDRPTEEVAFYYNKIQAQTLLTISNSLKAQGE